MTDTARDRQRRPLWADSLGEPPAGDDDVTIHRVDTTPEAPDLASPRHDGLRGPGVRLLLVALVAVLLALVAGHEESGGALRAREVPSGWGNVRMRCDTARLTRGGRTVELFRCRAVGGGTLPPGAYGTPEYDWNSDIDRRRALATDMRIDTHGVLTGWAVY